MIGLLERWGRRVRLGMAEVGYGARFFQRLCALIPAALARPRLVIDQLHFIGNRSLSIILVSGLFVGFVLGLQGYYTLQRYGSAEALGLLVALSLVRELGPVVAALLFAGRAGTSLTAEVGLMKAGEQLVAMEMMAVDPVARVLAQAARRRRSGRIGLKAEAVLNMVRWWWLAPAGAVTALCPAAHCPATAVRWGRSGVRGTGRGRRERGR